MSDERLTRQKVSQKYIFGEGLEVGAFHNPFPIIQGQASIKYVDKNTIEQLKEQYPDVDFVKKPVVTPDFIDDGEFLKSFQENSFDFLISSHQFEHCISPITALRHHLRVVKPGGILFYAIPDMRYSFDKKRVETRLEHVFLDFFFDIDLKFDRSSDAWMNRIIDHYNEYLEVVDGVKDPEERKRIAIEKTKKGGDIHFHCFTSENILKIFQNVQFLPYRFEILEARLEDHEFLLVLKKT